MRTKISLLLKDQTGATLAEYALLLTLISLAAITALSGIGQRLVTAFQSVIDKLI